jgi:hypothetical protein
LGDFDISEPPKLGGRGAECNTVCPFSDILLSFSKKPSRRLVGKTEAFVSNA